jgi:hypothetical protein
MRNRGKGDREYGSHPGADVFLGGVNRLIVARLVARQALNAIGLVLIELASFPIHVEPAHGQGAPAIRQPAPEPQGRLPIDGESARAIDRAVLRSAERRTIVLTVLDDETGWPLTPAVVKVNNHIDFQTHVFRTGPLGRLLLEYPSMHHEPMLSVEVRKDGYVPLGQGWGLNGRPGPPEAWTFRLRHGTTMGGIVVAAAERPVEGVTVLMTVTSDGPGARPGNSTGTEFYQGIPSRTGPDGRWRTDSVPPGADGITLRLIHPDFVSDGSPTLGWPVRSPKLAALREGSDRQVLKKGVALEGRVIDEQGRPIAGAQIDDSTRALRSSSEFSWCHPTDADGHFQFHLPRGTSFLLAASAEGYVPGTHAVSPDAELAAITFRLARGMPLRGRVVDLDGHPIEAALVIAITVPRVKPVAFRGWTDEHGLFEWSHAPAEPVDVSITADGYIGDQVHRLTAGGGMAEVMLRPAVDVHIFAIDAQTREPIPRFRTQIGSHDPGTSGFQWGPRMGRSAPRRFEISLEAEKGPFQLEISAEGYLPARIPVPKGRMILRRAVPLEKAAR